MRDSNEEERLRKLEAFLSTGNAFPQVRVESLLLCKSAGEIEKAIAFCQVGNET